MKWICDSHWWKLKIGGPPKQRWLDTLDDNFFKFYSYRCVIVFFFSKFFGWIGFAKGTYICDVNTLILFSILRVMPMFFYPFHSMPHITIFRKKTFYPLSDVMEPPLYLIQNHLPCKAIHRLCSQLVPCQWAQSFWYKLGVKDRQTNKQID